MRPVTPYITMPSRRVAMRCSRSRLRQIVPVARHGADDLSRDKNTYRYLTQSRCGDASQPRHARQARCNYITSPRYGAGWASNGTSAAASEATGEPPNAPGAATKLEAM